MADIAFITSNPAIAAYDTTLKNGQQLLLNDEELQSKRLRNDFDKSANPGRLRSIDAGADTARAGADVAVGTVPYDIATRQATSRSATSRANVDEGTEAPNIAKVRAGADLAVGTVAPEIATRQAQARSATSRANVDEGTETPHIDQVRSGARLASVNAGNAEATAPDVVAQSHARTRTMESQAQAEELNKFYRVLDLLNKGDIVSAKEIARQSGVELPDEAINDAAWRSSLAAVAERAKELYPNRPKDQQAYIGAQVDTLRALKNKGEQIQREQRYVMPQGAPTPPELSADGKGHQSPADVRTAEWLVANKVAGTAQEAWEMVRRSRSNPDATRASVFNSALRSTFGDQARAKAITDEFMKQINPPLPTSRLRQTNAGPVINGATVVPSSPPAAAPTAAPANPQDPTKPISAVQPPGGGTQQNPFLATVQEHVDWFRNQAPAGTVIAINGQLYTK